MGAVKYKVTNIPSGVTLSKTSNIDPNEAVNITLASSVVEGSTINLTVVAVDETGEEVSKVVSIPVNNNPVATTILATRNKTRYRGESSNIDLGIAHLIEIIYAPCGLYGDRIGIGILFLGLCFFALLRSKHVYECNEEEHTAKNKCYKVKDVLFLRCFSVVPSSLY